MPRLLSLSRAARLVGATRGKLQKQVQDGELNSFEGKISLSELQSLYPQANIEDTAMLDRVEEIIERARFKARSRTPMPTDNHSLLARASLLSDELAMAKLDLSNYAIFVQQLKSRLSKLAESTNTETRQVFTDLKTWLDQALPTATENMASPAHQLLVQDTMLRLITAQVHLRPSGHEYLLEGNNTLLEGGLSAGFALNYGCSNGNCGQCKARLISGQVKKTRPHDYSFTEAEKTQNYILMCCNTALTDVVLDADEADNSRDIPLQQITAKVRKLEQAGEHIHILNLKTPRTNRLRFLAGQQAKLTINDTLSKTLSIASCPCDDMNIQFHIDSREPDTFIASILEEIKSGDEVAIEGPLGEFVLDDDAANPVILIALDTGFAPIKSLAEHALTLAHAEYIQLHWIASDTQEHYMRNQCRAWTDAMDSLSYSEYRLGKALQPNEEKQELDELLDKIVAGAADINNCHVYFAGNARFIAAADKLCKTITAPRIKFEQTE